MPTSASPATVLPFTPAASVPAPTKPAAKKDDGGPSFSQALADQKSASRQDAPGKKAETQPSGESQSAEGKPADSQQDATPVASTDGRPSADPAPRGDDATAGTDTADTTAAQLAQAQALAAAQAPVAVATTPGLPLQALEIAAQSAALQSQSAAKLAALQSGSPADAAPQANRLAQGMQAAAVSATAVQTAAAAQQATALTQQAAQAALPAAAGPAMPQDNGNPLAAARPAIATARDPRAMAHAQAASQRAQATQDAITQPLATTDSPTAPLPDLGAQAAPARDDSGNARNDLAALSAAAQRSTPAQTTAAAADTRAAPAAPILEVASPVGSTNWGRDLGRQLVLLGGDAQRGQHTAELRLDPPDLGPLRVTLSLSDGVATANFMSAHASVRQALESALPQLQQALADAGISLGQADVGDQNQFAQEQSQANRQHGGQAASGSESQDETDGAQRVTIVRDGNALVDTFA
ncbi:flagellar hook-length control protein [Bordetella ansorpii]|uniref:Flagellar hook-length control protein n=1 Tax=Bordetella ansorpii TaxID=288768 RepID=A0A157M2N8_9BORD|nr:flagellar hook-length control protein FliK [Bordetella ansorpii]SAI02859.1 flagellar hook-length control protein [Bordetella ansorpii]